MTISKLSTLVSAQWLRKQIPTTNQLSSKLRVLDVSWDPAPGVSARDIYKQGHIPTSLLFDIKEICPEKRGATCQYIIPEPKPFQEYVEHLGISSDTHVVVYDRMPLRPAFRSWFLFRLFGHDKVSVLDGGLQQWKAQGYPITTDEFDVEKGVFEPNMRRQLLRDFDSMVSNVKTGAELIVDSRPEDSFNGTATDHVCGHMPGSINIPFSSLVNEDGLFKSVDDLKALFKAANVNLDKPLVATCRRGITACTLAAAALQCGKEDVPLYNGSFTEWGQIADPSLIQTKQ